MQVQHLLAKLAARACQADLEGPDPAVLHEIDLAPFLDPQRLPEQFRILEQLAAACGLTAFVFLQYVAARRYAPDLKNLAGIALAHTRITAKSHRLSGEAPWFTGWGLFPQVVVRAESELYLADTRDLIACPIPLCAMNASGTVSLRFENVPAQKLQDFDPTPEPWIDVRDSALPLGVATEALKNLPHTSLHDQRDDLRKNPNRREAIELALRATQANLIVAGGRGNRLDHPAQRLAREALFYALMAGQKEALLEQLTSRPAVADRCVAPA